MTFNGQPSPSVRSNRDFYRSRASDARGRERNAAPTDTYQPSRKSPSSRSGGHPHIAHAEALHKLRCPDAERMEVGRGRNRRTQGRAYEGRRWPPVRCGLPSRACGALGNRLGREPVKLVRLQPFRLFQPVFYVDETIDAKRHVGNGLGEEQPLPALRTEPAVRGWRCAGGPGTRSRHCKSASPAPSRKRRA